jgi:AraC-like DNA-binding protein
MRASSILVRAVIEAAELLGVDIHRLRREAGLDGEPLDPYAWLPGAQVDALLTAAVKLSARPDFGLEWGLRSPMHKLEVLPLLVSNTEALRDGIAAVERVQSLLFDPPMLRFDTSGEEAVVHVEADASLGAASVRVLLDIHVAGVMRLLRHYEVGRAYGPVRASFEHDDGGYRAAYQEVFDDVAFSQPHTELRFDARELARTHANYNQELRSLLQRQIELLRARMDATLTYSERLKSQLRTTLPRLPDMGEVARALDMSERSLRRRLSDEGTTFSQVLEQCQAELAHELLGRPGVSVKEVAFELGFDTVSGFYRAFRRWTGRSPAKRRLEPEVLGEDALDVALGEGGDGERGVGDDPGRDE